MRKKYTISRQNWCKEEQIFFLKKKQQKYTHTHKNNGCLSKVVKKHLLGPVFKVSVWTSSLVYRDTVASMSLQMDGFFVQLEIFKSIYFVPWGIAWEITYYCNRDLLFLYIFITIYKWASSRETLSSGFSTRSDSNRPAQPQNFKVRI